MRCRSDGCHGTNTFCDPLGVGSGSFHNRFDGMRHVSQGGSTFSRRQRRCSSNQRMMLGPIREHVGQRATAF